MAPDGYSLLLLNAQNTINATLYEKLNFDFVARHRAGRRDRAVPLVMEVNPSLPAKTVAEFIAYAKANPGKLNMASAGIGGPQHVAGELFKSHRRRRHGARALSRLDAGGDRPDRGQVQVMFDVTPTALPQIKGGSCARSGHDARSRCRRCRTCRRSASTVKGYEATAWVGIGAPKGTPPDIVARSTSRSTRRSSTTPSRSGSSTLAPTPQSRIRPPSSPSSSPTISPNGRR